MNLCTVAELRLESDDSQVVSVLEEAQKRDH